MPGCPFCEHQNPAGADRCAKCGASLTSIVEARDELTDAGEAVEAINPGFVNPKDTKDKAGTEFERQLAELLRNSGKIAAIKAYREHTGKGLKESKDAIEAFARDRGISAKQSGCAGNAVLLFVAIVLVAVRILAK